MAALTSDIVWLVKQTVTLAHDSTQDVNAHRTRDTPYCPVLFSLVS